MMTMMMMMMMIMMMMNRFCGMADRRKTFRLIFSRGHYKRSLPLRISNTPQAGFEPTENVSSGFRLMTLCSRDNHYTMAGGL